MKEAAREFGKELARHVARPEVRPAAPQQIAYLKPSDAAAYLKKSVDWIRRRAADGSLPYRKVGRDLRFIRSELEAWANKQR